MWESVLGMQRLLVCDDRLYQHVIKQLLSHTSWHHMLKRYMYTVGASRSYFVIYAQQLMRSRPLHIECFVTTLGQFPLCPFVTIQQWCHYFVRLVRNLCSSLRSLKWIAAARAISVGRGASICLYLVCCCFKNTVKDQSSRSLRAAPSSQLLDFHHRTRPRNTCTVHIIYSIRSALTSF